MFFLRLFFLLLGSMCSFQWLWGGGRRAVWGQEVFEVPAEGTAKLPLNRAQGTGTKRDATRTRVFCSASKKHQVSPVLSSHRGSLIGLRRVPRGWRGRAGCWLGSGGPASHNPARALRVGASRRALGPACRVLESRFLGSPRPQSLHRALCSPRLPTGLSFASLFLPFRPLHSAGFSSSSSALS